MEGSLSRFPPTQIIQLELWTHPCWLGEGWIGSWHNHSTQVETNEGNVFQSKGSRRLGDEMQEQNTKRNGKEEVMLSLASMHYCIVQRSRNAL
jgi:hypothetical protein